MLSQIVHNNEQLCSFVEALHVPLSKWTATTIMPRSGAAGPVSRMAWPT